MSEKEAHLARGPVDRSTMYDRFFAECRFLLVGTSLPALQHNVGRYYARLMSMRISDGRPGAQLILDGERGALVRTPRLVFDLTTNLPESEPSSFSWVQVRGALAPRDEVVVSYGTSGGTRGGLCRCAVQLAPPFDVADESLRSDTARITVGALVAVWLRLSVLGARATRRSTQRDRRQ